MEKLLQCIQMLDIEVVAQKLVIASQYAMIFQALVTISRLRFHVCMAEPSWRIVSIQKNVMCLLCMVAEVKMAAAVEDMVALVVLVGLVAMVEVALVDKVEVVMTGQILLMALMYWTRLETLQMENGGNLHIVVDIGMIMVAVVMLVLLEQIVMMEDKVLKWLAKVMLQAEIVVLSMVVDGLVKKVKEKVNMFVQPHPNFHGRNRSVHVMSKQ